MMLSENGQPIQKPNPYVQVVQKDAAGNMGGDPKDSVKFTYPKSKIFVGGLDFKLTSDELKEHFMRFGEVSDAIILKDIYTGQSRGFGFVTFAAPESAKAAIAGVNGASFQGRPLTVAEADKRGESKPKEDKSWVTSSKVGDGKRSWTEWS